MTVATLPPADPETSSIRVTRVSTGEDFAFGPEADDRSRELGDQLHLRTSEKLRPSRELVECRMHDESDHAELIARRCTGTCSRGPACRRVHGIYVALVKIGVGTSDVTWTVRHYDKQASHSVRSGESDLHKLYVEQWAIAATAGGHMAEPNFKLAPDDRRSPIADVLITGPAGKFDIEPQRYHHTIPGIKGRVTKLRKYGVEPIFNPELATPWSEAYAVPYARTNDLRKIVNTPKDSWIVVSGLRHAPETEWCHPSNDIICPVKGQNKWCGNRHPKLEPLHLPVYAVAERLPFGDLVVVKHARNGAQYLMPAKDRDLCLDHGGILLDTRPPLAPVSPVDAAPDPSDAVDNWRPREGFGSVLDQRRPEQITITVPVCSSCTVQTWNVKDGACTACRVRPALPQEKAAGPRVEVWPPPNPAGAASHCQKRGCGERLMACYPGQRFHPMCDPSPETWTAEQITEWSYRIALRSGTVAKRMTRGRRS